MRRTFLVLVGGMNGAEILVSLTNAVNLPIKLTRTSVVVVNWCSMGSGGYCHCVCIPFELPQVRTSPMVASLHL